MARVKEAMAEFPEGSGAADRNVNRVCMANKPESASGSQPTLGHKLESVAVELSGCTGGRGGPDSGVSLGIEDTKPTGHQRSLPHQQQGEKLAGGGFSACQSSTHTRCQLTDQWATVTVVWGVLFIMGCRRRSYTLSWVWCVL